MREIEISVSRTFPPESLRDEWKKKNPAGTFTAGPVARQAPSDIQEAIQKFGAVEIFNSYMKQFKLDLQNQLAEDIGQKVLDPTKVNKRAGKAVAINLD
jgi:hypothetical protein